MIFVKIWSQMIYSYSSLPYIQDRAARPQAPLPQITTCIPPVGRYYGTRIVGAMDTVALGRPPQWSWIHPAQVSDVWDFNHCSYMRFRSLDCQSIRDQNDDVGTKSRSSFCFIQSYLRCNPPLSNGNMIGVSAIATFTILHFLNWPPTTSI